MGRRGAVKLLVKSVIEINAISIGGYGPKTVVGIHALQCIFTLTRCFVVTCGSYLVGVPPTCQHGALQRNAARADHL